MRPGEASKVLSMLVRSDDEALGHWSARAKNTPPLSREMLVWWRDHLLEVADWLEAGAADDLEAARQALSRPNHPPAGHQETVHEAVPDMAPDPPVASAIPVPVSASSVPGATSTRSPWAAPPSTPSAPVPRTTAVDPADVAAALAAGPTPFQGNAPAPPSAVPAGPSDQAGDTAWVDPSVVAAAEAPGEGVVGSTEFMGPFNPDDFPDPVPFEGQAAAPPSSLDSTPHPAKGETAAVDPADVAAAMTGFHAFEAPAMSIETYAALVVSTENADEAARAALHRHHGLAGEAARRELDQDFGRALRRDAALREAFARAIAAERAKRGRQ
ncbi:MAG: hypothetical protein RIF41_24805 [Polyangiaceae bacterium]